MTDRLRIRAIDDDEGQTAAGSSHPPRQRVGGDLAACPDSLLSAQGMDVPAIAKVAFTSEDRISDVIRNFNRRESCHMSPLSA